MYLSVWHFEERNLPRVQDALNLSEANNSCLLDLSICFMVYWRSITYSHPWLFRRLMDQMTLVTTIFVKSLWTFCNFIAPVHVVKFLKHTTCWCCRRLVSCVFQQKQKFNEWILIYPHMWVALCVLPSVLNIHMLTLTLLCLLTYLSDTTAGTLPAHGCSGCSQTHMCPSTWATPCDDVSICGWPHTVLLQIAYKSFIASPIMMITSCNRLILVPYLCVCVSDAYIYPLSIIHQINSLFSPAPTWLEKTGVPEHTSKYLNTT